ncbi:hypothetical protein EVJ58_g3281 [Rhodofomes roseus]|uniref:DUF6532 domain-containing protein n=1 Tax=Rhodofomes roseus TaxID=34475 RepID=A0A4Y9YMQ6_9APHY|nr:hypothetical protein EVJ58_g3281 [Rhodofomes roseus]
MAPSRRKKKQLKRYEASQDPSLAQHDASSDDSPLVLGPRGATANGPGNAPGNEQSGLSALQKELGALRRTERDAFERAREEEIANPTIWKPKKNDKRQLEDESQVDSPEEPVAPAVKRMRKDMIAPAIADTPRTTQKALKSAQGSPAISTADDLHGLGVEDEAETARAAGHQAEEVEMNVVDGETDVRSDCEDLYETPAPAQKRTGRRVIQSSSDQETDDGEYESGEESDNEEDFGEQSAAAFPPSRKVAKVAEQLKQGSAKLVSTRKTKQASESVSSDDLDGLDLAADFLEPGYVSDGPRRDESDVPAADRAHGDVPEDACSDEDREEARPSDDHWVDDNGRTWTEVVVHRAQVRKSKGRNSETTANTRKKHPDKGQQLQSSGGMETGSSIQNKKRADSLADVQRALANTPQPQTTIPRMKPSGEGRAKVKLGLGPKPHDPAVAITKVAATSTAKVAATSTTKPTSTTKVAAILKTRDLESTTRVQRREVANDTQIVSGGIGSESDQDGRDSDGPDPETAPTANGWPEDTDITYADRNKVAGLTSQKSLKIRALLKTTIAHELPRALALINAFPDVVDRVQMFVDIFLDGTRRLGPEYNVIGQRVLQDTAYVQSLLVLPAKRMCTIRGPWYLACRDAVWEGYGLKAIEHDPVALKHGVEVLLHDGQFICPGKLVNDRYTEFKRDLPFCAETIIKLASILFLGPQAVRPLEDTCFTSSIKTGPESEQREIPPAMAALLATLAGAAIGEGLHGLRDHLKDGEGFIANQQERLYRGHLAALSTLHPLGRHKILGYIFKEAKAFHKRKSVAPTHTNMASTFLNPSTAGMDIDL